MNSLRLSCAVSGGELTDADEWVHALIVGPVADRATGQLVATITDEYCAEVVKGYTALGGRMATPIDLDHGLDTPKANETPAEKAERRRTYGRVSAVEHRKGQGVFVKMALNEGGVQWVKDNAGCAYVSPSLRLNLFDPQKPGELLSKVWMRALSLTPTPKQATAGEVKLSEDAAGGSVLLAEFSDREEYAEFEQHLTLAADAALRTEGYAPGYLLLQHWDGAESGAVVVSWYDDAADSRHMRRLTWSRSDGAVSVTGPAEAVEARTVYVSPDSDITPPDDGQFSEAQEVPMPDPKPFAALLSEVSDEVRESVTLKLSELTEQVSTAEAARAEAATQLEALKLQLSETAASLETEKSVASKLEARLAKVETEVKAKAEAEAKAERDAFVGLMLSEGAIPAEDVKNDAGEVIDGPGFWADFHAQDKARALRLSERLPKHVHGPKPGAAGLNGRDAQPADTEASKALLLSEIEAEAKAIQARGLESGDVIAWMPAWKRAEAAIAAKGVKS